MKLYKFGSQTFCGMVGQGAGALDFCKVIKQLFFFFTIPTHLGSVEIWEGVFALDLNKAICFV